MPSLWTKAAVDASVEFGNPVGHAMNSLSGAGLRPDIQQSSRLNRVYPASRNPPEAMACAWPRTSADEMQYVVSGSVQSSSGPFVDPQRNSSHDIQPRGGSASRWFRVPPTKVRRGL